MEKQELQTLRMWNPLFPKIYRKNEWGDTEYEPEDMDANEIRSVFYILVLFIQEEEAEVIRLIAQAWDTVKWHNILTCKEIKKYKGKTEHSKSRVVIL